MFSWQQRVTLFANQKLECGISSWKNPPRMKLTGNRVSSSAMQQVVLEILVTATSASLIPSPHSSYFISRVFASNIGLPFLTPEEIFTENPPDDSQPAEQPRDDSTSTP